MKSSTDLFEQRYVKLEEIKRLGLDPYPHKYAFTHTVDTLVEDYSPKTAENLEEEKVQVRTCGRLMALRPHGKAGFGHIAGGGERIQIYVRKDTIGEENFALFKLLDLGDIIGVEGHLFRTRTGELTIFADRLDLLSKSLLPLPEKWHGLTDVETRYRQRYVDLIVNPEVREIFVRRSQIVRELRKFMERHEFLEVETPMMQPLAGGAMARPFETFHEALGIPLYLRIAPELYLKRLTVGGLDRVYEINRNFRNEGISRQHNPEFTMLEFYAAYSDYRDLMDFTEEMLGHVLDTVFGNRKVTFGEHILDFSSFTRLTMIEAVQKFWPEEKVPSESDLRDKEWVSDSLKRMGIGFEKDNSWGKLFGLLFDSIVEEFLIQPTFIYDYPVELSPLSKRKDSDPALVERFELYVAGLEIANAYSELNDPEEQRMRFEEQLVQKSLGDSEAHEMDEDYIRALRYGLPPAAGEGVGIDRLTMILTGVTSIREVILFPQLRPEAGRQALEE